MLISDWSADVCSSDLRGHRVIRNRRYTGDGGIDGEVIIDGQRWLIQAKRYRDAIRPEHVWDFAQMCATRRRRGMFIHTGRTGGMSRTVVDRATGRSAERR